METSVSYVVKAHNLCSPLFILPTTRPTNSWAFVASSSSSQPYKGRLLGLEKTWQQQQQLKKVVFKCAKGGSSSASELRDEIITEEELMGLGRLGNECCKESSRGGIAELLECLEREAIMGEDEGKEPTDYNRRAQIFDKSSIVFQALKESSTTTPLP
ncbi:hypothetical protein ACH5RR_019475 [Cinchona calisaya]|uniref:Uncharacterized protein n=1 Tax=Cinchona calisaya TaxID=153742 RepID=A0ABD2ZPI4_9GENT